MSNSLRPALRPAGRVRIGNSAILLFVMVTAMVAAITPRASGQSGCPCSVWTTTTTPGPMDSEAAALELGMKFQADVSGMVTGIRFYKYAQNSGTHVGHLWSASGTLLGSVTFTNETASGWQQATFAAPIAIAAATTYVIAYHTAVGRYAATPSGFTTAVTSGPLHALASAAAGGNGVYAAAPGTANVFPTLTWNAANYWVDVVFATSVGPDTTLPTVALTAPANGATVAGTALSVSATASDNVGVVGVQFKLDGANLGVEDATSPYGVTWNTTTLVNGSSHTLTAVARDAAGNTATATSVTVTVDNADATLPTVALTAPANGATVAGTAVTVSATASDNVGVAGVQFKLDGANLGAEDTTSPYGVTWNTTTLVNGSSHTLTAVARDAAGNTATATSVTVTVDNADATLPTVALTAPANGATVAGTAVTVSATASDNVGVAGVQFKLDGANLGAEDTTSPYSTTFNTTTVADGGHTLTAVARDAAGNTATATSVTVTVSNSPGSGCPCSVWTTTTTPGPMDSEAAALELGMKFQADVSGMVTGIRFYKYAQNSGTHVGHLWSASGTLLGSVTFTNETASGWQQATFAAPIAIAAATTYVIAYHTAVGRYAATPSGFTTAVTSGPLHALASAAAGGNGVYAAAPGTANVFPTLTWNAANYWVDVVFATSVGPDTTLPTVALTAPANGATVAGTALSVSATASDNVGVAGVQFKLDGANLGAEDTTSPYSVPWNTTTLVNGSSHTLTAVARDAAGNTATATSVTVTVDNTNLDTTSPIVAISAPLNGVTVSGAAVTVSADASDNIGVVGVQFKLDGADLGVEDTTSPYSVTWNTTTLVNGNHTLTAIARDASGNAVTAANATVNVNNVDTTPPTVVTMTPAGGATNVATATTVTAIFSEALNAATVTTATVTLQGPGTTAVPAAVSYNASTRVATLTPVAALGSGTLYTATVKGGASGVTDVAGNPLSSNVTWTFTTATSTLAQMGQWSSVLSWPLVVLNATLVKTGELLLWDGGQSAGSSPTHGGQSARLWNPTTQAFTSVPLSRTDLFCSASCALPDGRIFVAGGGAPENDNFGVPDANIFNPSTRAWSSAPNMSARRWYPTTTCLPDGRVLVTSGSQFNDFDWVNTPEIYNPATNSWSKQNGATAAIPYYPHVFVLPDGRLLDSSSFQQPMTSDVLDLGTQMRIPVSSQSFDGGSAAMYLPGKILKTGTAAFNNGSTSPAASTSYVLDMTQPAPSWRQTSSMHFPRSYHTLTMLPDQTVLVTGGGKTKSSTDISNAVYSAEIWSPVTESWTTVAAMQTPRLYHSVAILLPDGRVAVAGGGRNFNDGAAYKSAEIYSPPYLFKGARPTITSAPGTVSYGGNIAIQTPDAATITSVVLVRTGAVTHGINMDQRLVPLTFQQATGGLTIRAPSDANLAPPGYYMVFLVNATGVPSVASMIRVGP